MSKNVTRFFEAMNGTDPSAVFSVITRPYDIRFHFRVQEESEPLGTARLEVSDDKTTWHVARHGGDPIEAVQAVETVAESVAFVGVRLTTGRFYRFTGTSTAAIDVRVTESDWPTRAA